jgi:purine-nucleoside phosphorylase
LLYIITALKPEAQAFVEHYKLTKAKLGIFTLFYNDTIRLLVSGLGVTKAREATQTLINHYDITDEDSYLNIGICGANNSYEIGAVLEIGSIVYADLHYRFDETKKEIVCLDSEAKDATYDIVDMESFGFYDAVIHSPAIKNFSIIKVVSDHFEPHKVTKDATKTLIHNAIKELF